MKTETNKKPEGSDKVDALVRHCGSCIHFDAEDISGSGWCTAADHAAECDEESCPSYHNDFYTPNIWCDLRLHPEGQTFG